MPRHVRVAAVEHRIEVAGLDHRNLGIVGHQQLRHSAEECEGRIVSLGPVRKLLGPGRTRKRQARAAQHRHEQMRIADLAGPAVHHHRHRVASVINEQLLAARMALAHHQRQPTFPAAEQVAPAAVAIPVRVCRVVLLPQHLQRHVLAFQLPRHHRPVGLGLLAAAGFHARHAVKSALQLGVRHFIRDWPGQPRPSEPPQRIPDRRRADPDPFAYHPRRQPTVQA